MDSEESDSFYLLANSYVCGHFPDEHNRLISSFNRIEFYEEDSEIPYKGYHYPMVMCVESARGDEYRHQSSTGTWESLFLESSDRPFFLETDKYDSYSARIVVTFVPSAEQASASAAE